MCRYLNIWDAIVGVCLPKRFRFSQEEGDDEHTERGKTLLRQEQVDTPPPSLKGVLSGNCPLAQRGSHAWRFLHGRCAHQSLFEHVSAYLASPPDTQHHHHYHESLSSSCPSPSSHTLLTFRSPPGVSANCSAGSQFARAGGGGLLGAVGIARSAWHEPRGHRSAEHGKVRKGRRHDGTQPSERPV